MVRKSIPLILLVSLLGYSPPTTADSPRSAPPVVIDGLAAEVNGQPITLNRVFLYREWLAATEGKGLQWPTPLTAARWSEPNQLLELVILDELLYSEASRTDAIQLREATLQEARTKLEAQFPDQETFKRFCARFEFNDAYMREFLSRRVRIVSYIQLKVGAARPGAQDVRQYYEAHRTDYQAMDPAEAKTEIETLLYMNRTAQRFDAWARELRTKADVRVVKPTIQP